MLPSMWRTELLHPVSVHFPIALLIVGSAFYILSVFFKKHEVLRHLKFFSFLLILIGTISAWIAIFTGGLAEEIVGPNLCDPDVRLNHEDFAYYTAYIFTTFVVLHLISQRLSQRLSSIFFVINVFLVLSGSALLGYVGHLGATLTYQQAAGVYNPGPECKGFE